MNFTRSLLILGTLAVTACASTITTPPPSPEVAGALDSYLLALNQASPSDPVYDSRDSSLGPRLTPPVELRRVQPALTSAARRQSKEGKVFLGCVVERDGSVTNIRVVSATGHSDFTAASVDAVRQWKYTPAILDGSPVRTFMIVTTSYRVN